MRRQVRGREDSWQEMVSCRWILVDGNMDSGRQQSADMILRDGTMGRWIEEITISCNGISRLRDGDIDW